MNQPVMQVKNLRKQFGPKEVLRGIDLAIEPGTVLGLLGANGSGKTTLIKCTLGLLRSTSGESTIFGENSWDLSACARRGSGMCRRK
jgi:ABC-type multidrug transport system ATPase subunit